MIEIIYLLELIISLHLHPIHFYGTSLLVHPISQQYAGLHHTVFKHNMKSPGINTLKQFLP